MENQTATEDNKQSQSLPEVTLTIRSHSLDSSIIEERTIHVSGFTTQQAYDTFLKMYDLTKKS